MSKPRYFQFLAGQRRGEVVVYDQIVEEDGMVFVCFKDNSRCNEDLIIPINDRNWQGKYMAEVEDSHNVWTFKEEWVGRQEEVTALNAEQERVIVQPFIEGKKKVTPIPPKKTTSNFGTIDKHVEPAPPPKPKVEDPVFLMVDKAKKFDTEVSLNMTVSLPKQSLYSIIEESFDDGGKKMIDYIVDNMDVQVIKDALKDALLDAYVDEVPVEVPVEVPQSSKIVTEEVDNSASALYEPEVVEEPVVGEPIAAEVIDDDKNDK